MTWYALLKAVHVLSAVVWVGGMVFAHLVLRPSLAVLEPPARMALMRDVLRRFFLIVWHAMPLMILTGFAIIFGVAGGMPGVRWNIHVMLLLGLIMSGIFVVIFFGPWRAFRAAPGPDTLASIRRLVGINMILGLLTVLIGVLG